MKRLHPSVNKTYQDIWHRVTASFSPHMLESFLTPLLLHAQNCDLSNVPTPVSIENQSRHLIRKIAKILMLLIGNGNNESILFLIKYKYFVEILSRLTDETGNVLDFELNSEDEEVIYLRQLVEVKDGLLDLPEIENDVVAEDQEEIVSKSDQIVDSSEKHFNTEIPIVSISTTENVDSQPADSDDDDEFEPYPMEEESENDDDKCEPQIKKKKILSPTEIAMNTAAKLIRNKTGFGMELDDHVVELARILINLRDAFELKGFEENRQAAVVALVCGSPKITVPYAYYSTMHTVLMILSALSSAAKELSGLQIEEDIPAKKEISSVDLITQSTNDLSLITKNALSKPASDKILCAS
ncbi:18412_t:CDS:2 [Racocetra fulgida]|uniref:18412_t:CDS:1 n=1 Tax=Racocetra fulgida TaxID=60492 RepID=A0A9N8ZA83_9GLOM|nr:18412_t:CDS:2 [Racocetra fulgida]